MRRLYWRPRGISPTILALVALIAILVMAAVEIFPVRQRQPHYPERLRAAQLALEGMEILRAERLNRGTEIDGELDPADSGMIGLPMSPVTTVTGVLAAKQTSVNPNFAAVVLDMLTQAGVQKGDAVAIGASGSFPALNLCVYAAARALDLRVIVIASISASQFGANDPEFLWIDMERVLHETNPDNFPYRCLAVSLGGVDDRGLGMPKEGKEALLRGVQRNNLTLIKPASFEEGVARRMALYTQEAGARPIRAYVNIGGGTISVGSVLGKRMFQPGLNLRRPPGIRYVDSVMTRFIDRDVPVIHLSHIERLAKAYGLPLQPTRIPSPGEGSVFFCDQYNLYLVSGGLLAILGSLYGLLRSEYGYLILQTRRRTSEETFYEPMV